MSHADDVIAAIATTSQRHSRMNKLRLPSVLMDYVSGDRRHSVAASPSLSLGHTRRGSAAQQRSLSLCDTEKLTNTGQCTRGAGEPVSANHSPGFQPPRLPIGPFRSLHSKGCLQWTFYQGPKGHSVSTHKMPWIYSVTTQQTTFSSTSSPSRKSNFYKYTSSNQLASLCFKPQLPTGQSGAKIQVIWPPAERQ